MQCTRNLIICVGVSRSFPVFLWAPVIMHSSHNSHSYSPDPFVRDINYTPGMNTGNPISVLDTRMSVYNGHTRSPEYFDMYQDDQTYNGLSPFHVLIFRTASGVRFETEGE